MRAVARRRRHARRRGSGLTGTANPAMDAFAHLERRRRFTGISRAVHGATV